MTDPAKAPGGQPPPIIPGYRIEAALGRGASGVVYRAVQLSIGRVVALKVLHHGSVRDTRVVRRLQREARTAARLAHPNIISAIDMGHTEDTWWFAMELVVGHSLAERITHGGRLSERKALAIFIPLCDALQHTSEKGVVHRDIKPANILLEHDDRPRLVDLGLARIEDDPMLTRTGATLGTPHYISPEQARDPSKADARSDIWSLGATLFHAVCGRPPFEGASAAELLSNVLYGEIPDARAVRPELSKGLALVLRKCLSRDPDRRYFAAAELQADLERVRARKPPAIRKSALEPLGTAVAWDWPRVLALSAAAVLLLALFAWRPWRAGEGAADDAQRERLVWPRFETLVAEHERGDIQLAEVWAERELLCAQPAPGYTADCLELQQDLAKRLEDTYYELTNDVGERVEGLVTERRFDEVDALIQARTSALLERTGFRPSSLPGRFADNWSLLVERQRDVVKRTREGARDALVKVLGGHVDAVLLPRVGVLRGEGRFAEALELVGRRPQELFDEAGVDARGLDAESLADHLHPLDLQLREAAFALSREQRKLDTELARWVDQQAAGYEERLRARTLREASQLFAAEFRQELARAGLNHARMREEAAGEGLAWNALAAYDKRQRELFDLERDLISSDAERRFEELEAKARPDLERREYEAVATFWSAHAADPALAPVERLVALRVAEAEQLSRLLARAAAGVAALDQQHVELPVASIKRAGRIETQGNPLADGFQLVHQQGGRATFRLRSAPEGGEKGTLLDARAVEFLARAAPPGADGADLPLQLALFRYHEGDLPGARQLLAESELSDEDYLVYDLDLRLEEGIDRQASRRTEERSFARESYDRLTGRKIEGDARKAVSRIDVLLRKYPEFFSPRELGTLRELKRSLGGGESASTVEEFRELFGIEAVRFVDPGDVVLEYSFNAPEAGTWQRGEWDCDGTGWVRGAPVGSDLELTRSKVPTLLLLAPFVVGSRPEVRILLEQPSDSPPQLLVVSVFGFHAVFLHDAVQARAHCLVDTVGMIEIIERARGGEGTPFAGFQPGRRHELSLRVNPERGQAWVSVDGEELALPMRSRAGSKRSQSVSIRSLEPVLLVKAVVRGARR